MKKRNARVFAMFMSSMLTFTSMAPATVMAAEEEGVIAEAAVADEEVEETEDAAEEDAEEVEEETEEVAEEAEVEDSELVGKTRGECGDNMSFEIRNGIMRIYATDDTKPASMYNYTRDDSKPAPWRGENFTTVKLQGQVSNIGDFAFYDCDTVEKVELNTYVKKIGESSFESCDNLNEVSFILNDQEPINITEYGVAAFKDCVNLEKMEISKQVESINNFTFYNCGKFSTDLSQLPTTLKYIGMASFWGCKSLKKVSIPSSVITIDGGFDTTKYSDPQDAYASIAQDGLEGIWGAFTGCTGITSFTISAYEDLFGNDQGVRSIGDFALFGCSSLGGLTIPYTVKGYLGDFVAAECTSLQNAVVADGVTGSLDQTFLGCEKLQAVTIGCDVKEVGDECFRGCSLLNKVDFNYDTLGQSAVQRIGKYAFERCVALKQIDLPDCGKLKEIDQFAFSECTALDNVVVPEGVEYLRTGAFYTCTAMSTIYLPSTLQKVEATSFTTASDDDSKMRLQFVYYGGSENDWKNINIATTGNTIIIGGGKVTYRATKVYNVYSYADVMEAPNVATDGNKIVVSWKEQPLTVDGEVILNTKGNPIMPTEYRVWRFGASKTDIQGTWESKTPYWVNDGGIQTTSTDFLIENKEEGSRYAFRVQAVYGDFGTRLSEAKEHGVGSADEADKVTALAFEEESYSVKTGKDTQVTVGVTPYNADASTIVWSSSDTTIATVQGDGATATIHGIKAGTVTLKATTDVNDPYAPTATVRVKVSDEQAIAVNSLAFTSATVTIGQGEGTTKLNLVIDPLDADTTDFEWTVDATRMVKLTPSQDKKYATIEGLEVGETTVKVTSANGKTATCKVIVAPGSTHQKVVGFVDRLYAKCLFREADENGENYWVNLLETGSLTGAQVAEQFIFSNEANNKNFSDEEFITLLYDAMMDRTPDADGMNYWLNNIANGWSRYEVLDGFIVSDVFGGIWSTYKINRGALDKKTTVPIEKFVIRMYEKSLQRTAEQGGIYYWTFRLRNHEENGATFADKVFFSDEMNGYNLNDAEFIERLYNAMMDRPSDADGMAYWMNNINNGMTRKQVLSGFINSAEFTGICDNYGIERGSLGL